LLAAAKLTQENEADNIDAKQADDLFQSVFEERIRSAEEPALPTLGKKNPSRIDKQHAKSD
jgi:hypothetical protein